MMQAKSFAISPQLSGVLDFVRWLAALLVVIGHVRLLWCTEYANVHDKSPWVKIFYFVTGFGSEAVMVFFVLSGFLVGGGALRKWYGGTYSGRDYFISRFSRIYTVLLPALVCGGLLDWIGLQYFNATGIYTNSPAYRTPLLNFHIAGNLDWATFLANLANLQGILASHFGSNGPLWSLAYEWWYYCLFGLMLEAAGKKSADPVLWLLASGALLALTVLPAKLLLYMLVWGTGAWAATLDPQRLKLSPFAACVLFVSLLAGSRLFHILLDGYTDHLPGSMVIRFVPNLLLAAGFSLLIISLRGKTCTGIRSFALHKFMADFSYTIYLMHVPLLLLITAILSSNYGVPFSVEPTFKVLLFLAVLILLIYLALYLFSLLTEKFTPNVKGCLAGLFAPNRLKINPWSN